MSVGEYPTPMARSSYLSEEDLDMTRSAPASDHHQYVYFDREAPRTTSRNVDPVGRYREESLDDSAHASVELMIEPMPHGSASTILRWIIQSIERNPGHAQLTIDATLESAEQAGLSAESLQDLARQAIAQFAREHGRF